MKSADSHDAVRTRVNSIRARLEKYSALPLDQLYQVKDDLVLLRVLRDELLERLEADDPPSFRKRAVELFDKMSAALASEPDKAAALLRDLGVLLEQGVASDESVDRLLSQTHELIKRCVSLEELRLKSERSVSVAELDRFTHAIIRALRAELPAADVARVLGHLNREAFRGRLQIETPPRETDVEPPPSS